MTQLSAFHEAATRLSAVVTGIREARAEIQRERDRRRRWEASDQLRTLPHIDCVHERVVIDDDFPRLDADDPAASLAALVASNAFRAAAVATRDRAHARGTDADSAGHGAPRTPPGHVVDLRADLEVQETRSLVVDGNVRIQRPDGGLRSVALFDPTCEWVDGQPWCPLWDVLAAFLAGTPGAQLRMFWDGADHVDLFLTQRHPAAIYSTWELRTSFGFADDAAECRID